MIQSTTLQPGESYATVAHIRDYEDLPKLPVVVDAWGVDDAPCKILLRGLSFAERRLINQKAKDSDDQFNLLTCLHGIEQPRFAESQLDVLAAKHPAAIDAIAAAIWRLSGLPADIVAAEVRRLADLPPAPSGDPEPETSSDE